MLKYSNAFSTAQFEQSKRCLRNQTDALRIERMPCIRYSTEDVHVWDIKHGTGAVPHIMLLARQVLSPTRHKSTAQLRDILSTFSRITL